MGPGGMVVSPVVDATDVRVTGDSGVVTKVTTVGGLTSDPGMVLRPVVFADEVTVTGHVTNVTTVERPPFGPGGTVVNPVLLAREVTVGKEDSGDLM